MKPTIMRVDKPTPCFIPVNRDIFEEIINRTQPTLGRAFGNRPRLRKAIEAARPICGGCPEREQCLDVHGRDYRLGVVAGLTDEQRAAALGAA